MSGELKLINIMLVVLLGVWLGTAINTFTVPSGAANVTLGSSSRAVSARDATTANAPADTQAPSLGVQVPVTPCPPNEILVLFAGGTDGAGPTFPDDAARYCARAGPLPGGLTVSGGWCYAVDGSLACTQVLDEHGGVWSCLAALGATPAWQDFSYARPACVPRVSATR